MLIACLYREKSVSPFVNTTADKHDFHTILTPTQRSTTRYMNKYTKKQANRFLMESNLSLCSIMDVYERCSPKLFSFDNLPETV